MTRIEDLTPAALLEAALKANSPFRVLVATLLAAFRTQAKRPFAHELPTHLRKDIGLPPHAPPPMPPELMR